jgi:hypothetical protein
MVRFQMKTSTRPQTIAVVNKEVDIKSFRDNPEWYEIKDYTEPANQQQQQIVTKLVKSVKKTKESK